MGVTAVLAVVCLFANAKAAAAATYVYSGTVSFTYYLNSGEAGNQISKNITLTYNGANTKAGQNVFRGKTTGPAAATFFISNKKGIAQIEPGKGNSIIRLPYFTAAIPKIGTNGYETTALNAVRNGVFAIYDAKNDTYIKLRVTGISRATRKTIADPKKPITDNSSGAVSIKPSIPVSVPVTPPQAIQPAVLPAPRFVTPYNNQVVKPVTGMERDLDPVWTAVPGADKYIIETNHYRCVDWRTPDCWIAYDRPYSVSAAETNQGATNIFTGLFLGSDGTFRMRIRAVDKFGVLGNWSEYVPFTVDTSVINVVAPTIDLPVSGQVFANSNRMVTIAWGWVQGAIKYQVTTECARPNDLSQYSLVSDITTEEILLRTANFAISYDATCRTRARGYSLSGIWGPWSDYRLYTIDSSGSQSTTVLNTQPTITAPVPGDNFMGKDGAVRIAWTRADAATRYQVVISCMTCSINDPWWNIKDTIDLSVLVPLVDFAPGGRHAYEVTVMPVGPATYIGTRSEPVIFTVEQ